MFSLFIPKLSLRYKKVNDQLKSHECRQKGNHQVKGVNVSLSRSKRQNLIPMRQNLIPVGFKRQTLNNEINISKPVPVRSMWNTPRNDIAFLMGLNFFFSPPFCEKLKRQAINTPVLSRATLADSFHLMKMFTVCHC